jgi:hypothetical protein
MAQFSPAFSYFVAPVEMWCNGCDLTLFYSGPLGINVDT